MCFFLRSRSRESQTFCTWVIWWIAGSMWTFTRFTKCELGLWIVCLLKKSTFTVSSAITIPTSKTQTRSTLPKSCLVISIQTFTSTLILCLGLGNKTLHGSVDQQRESRWNFEWIKSRCSDSLWSLWTDGYQVMRNVSIRADKIEILWSFDRVWSGHFHQNMKKQCVLLRHCLSDDLFWSLWEKGFHIYDTETDEIEFVENPHRFFTIPYRDNIDIDAIDYKQYKKSYVKVFVHEKKVPQSLIGCLSESTTKHQRAWRFLKTKPTIRWWCNHWRGGFVHRYLDTYQSTRWWGI